jgi:hypothetical protein
MLDIDSAADYLIVNGLIDPDVVIDGKVIVTSAARRNRNLRVVDPAGVGYFLKQPEDPIQEGAQTLSREAAFHGFCKSEPAATAVAQLLPRLVYYDAGQNLLVLELLGDAAPLWQHFQARDAQHFPVSLAQAVGVALASLHNTFRGPVSVQDSRLGWLPRQCPWAMRVHKPQLQQRANISQAICQALRVLQTHEGLGEKLEKLRDQWQHDTVIHNDIKSDNLLLIPARPGDQEGPADVRIVDWEFVQVGDPAWDVAGALQDLVHFWINSMDVLSSRLEPACPWRPGHLPAEAPEEILNRLIGSARYPLATLHKAWRAFWKGYKTGAGLSPTEANRLLLRAVLFSAARLIQTALELAQSLSSMPAETVLLLQIAAKVLDDPETEQLRLYGIPREIQAAHDYDPSRPAGGERRGRGHLAQPVCHSR